MARIERLQREGGIMFEDRRREGQDAPGIVNVLGVEVPTFATEEEVRQIQAEMVLSATDQDLLRAIAESYELRQPLLLEGDPGSGKTFLQRQFVRLVHGAEAPTLRLAGTPRTSELDILGHWAPRGLDGTAEDAYQEELRKIIDSPEQIADKELAVAALKALGRLRSDTEWEFKPGALLQAYAGREGRGYILMVDEFNLIPSNYQQILLEISGEFGGLSDAIHFWGNGGQPRYERGPDTWVCLASNFPEQTPGRNEVVRPMTDRLVWKVVRKDQSQAKEEAVIRSLGGQITAARAEVGALDEEAVRVPAGEQLDWRSVGEQRLAYELADIIQAFHKSFKESYERSGDEIAVQGDEHRSRRQQFEFSSRNALRLCHYLDRFQVRNRSGAIDFAETLRRGVRRHYVDRLMKESLREQAMAALEAILTGEEGKKKFNKKIMKRETILAKLVEEAMMTPELAEQRRQEEEARRARAKEQKEREREGQRRDIAGQLGEMAADPTVPEEVRRRLQPTASSEVES
jgi:MoxR-like ATPase